MFYFQLDTPLQPEIMDSLLAQGYYRMRQTMFTTHFTLTDTDQLIQVLWARVNLESFEINHRHKALTRRCRRFSTALFDAAIDDEVESLYAAYRENVDFQAPNSVREFLMGSHSVNYFPSRMWQVRDADVLIAIGYFDEGVQSAAGILNFYDPNYRKFSLSKWLYFESVRYAAATGKSYFYPGYVALNFPKFDYKLEVGKERIEIWSADMLQWIPYELSEHAMAIESRHTTS